MRLSIFQNDDGLAGSSVGNCSCLHGEAYVDASGDCRCLGAGDPNPNDPPRNTGDGGGPLTWPQRKEIVNHVYVTTLPWEPISGRPDQEGTKTAAGDFTLFGLSPLMLAILAGGGLWLMSSMDGKKKKGGDY